MQSKLGLMKRAGWSGVTANLTSGFPPAQQLSPSASQICFPSQVVASLSQGSHTPYKASIFT